MARGDGGPPAAPFAKSATNHQVGVLSKPTRDCGGATRPEGRNRRPARCTLESMSPTFPKAVPAERESPPRGFYHAAEVGQLAGVSGAVIGQWKRHGYIQASQSAGEYPNVYAYQDVAEAMVVHDLVDRGVPLRRINRVITRLREENGRDWPLQAESLLVPGDSESRSPVYVETGGDHIDPDSSTPWNYVIDPGGLRVVARELRRGGWAVRQLPDLRHIEVNPDKMSGRPSIKGVRIAAEDVAIIAEESGPTIVKAEFGLEDSEIRDAAAWWGAVQRFEEAA